MSLDVLEFVTQPQTPALRPQGPFGPVAARTVGTSGGSGPPRGLGWDMGMGGTGLNTCILHVYIYIYTNM